MSQEQIQTLLRELALQRASGKLVEEEYQLRLKAVRQLLPAEPAEAETGADGLIESVADVSQAALTRQRIPEDATLTAGMKVDRFQLIEKIGEGGMGLAWKAVDPKRKDNSHDGYVVLKFLKPEEQANERALERSRAAFRAISHLQHQNICPVYDLIDDRQFGSFQVMKYVDGITLSQFRRIKADANARLDLNRVMKIVTGVSAALQDAHDSNVLHRDIKPDNILIDRGGRLQVIDFGLAGEMHGEKDQSKGVIAGGGTPAYMAPEQLLEEKQTAATDQYSLAVVAWELLTGSRPFAHKNTRLLLQAMLHNDLPEAAFPPQGVRIVLEKALQSDRRNRFNSMSEFASALEDAVIVSRAVQAGRPKSPVQRQVSPKHQLTPDFFQNAPQSTDADDSNNNPSDRAVPTPQSSESSALTNTKDASPPFLKPEQKKSGPNAKPEIPRQANSAISAPGERQREPTNSAGTRQTASKSPSDRARQHDRPVVVSPAKTSTNNPVTKPQIQSSRVVPVWAKFVGVVAVAVVLIFCVQVFWKPGSEQNDSVAADTPSQEHSAQSNSAAQNASAVEETIQIKFRGQDGMSIGWIEGSTLLRNQRFIPGQAEFKIGSTVRLIFANIPGEGWEGFELYPTLDVERISPEAVHFLESTSVPLEITDKDLEFVRSGNVVTKVIYWPKPEFQRRAIPGVEPGGDFLSLSNVELDPGTDPVQMARSQGEVIAVFRMGNKQIDLKGLTEGDSSMPSFEGSVTAVDSGPSQSQPADAVDPAFAVIDALFDHGCIISARDELADLAAADPDRAGILRRSTAITSRLQPHETWLRRMLDEPVPQLDFPGENSFSDVLNFLSGYFTDAYGSIDGKAGFQFQIVADTGELLSVGASSLDEIIVTDFSVDSGSTTLEVTLNRLFEQTKNVGQSPEPLKFIIRNEVIEVTTLNRVESEYRVPSVLHDGAEGSAAGLATAASLAKNRCNAAANDLLQDLAVRYPRNIDFIHRLEAGKSKMSQQEQLLNSLVAEPAPLLEFPGETPLADILEFVSSYYSAAYTPSSGGKTLSMQFSPDMDALSLEGIDSLSEIKIADVNLKGISLRSALNLIFQQTRDTGSSPAELVFVIRNDVIEVTTATKFIEEYCDRLEAVIDSMGPPFGSGLDRGTSPSSGGGFF